MSHTVYEQVKNKLALDYRSLGAHRVKNIAEPVRVYAVGTAVTARRFRRWRVPIAAGVAGIVIAAGLVFVVLDRSSRQAAPAGAAIAAPAVATLAAPARLAERTPIAVLPFKNLSGDPGQDFFSDGVTEDIINALGRFSNLLVAAKSASSNSRAAMSHPR